MWYQAMESVLSKKVTTVSFLCNKYKQVGHVEKQDLPCQSFEHENPSELLSLVEIKKEVMDAKDLLYEPLTMENPTEFVQVMSIKEELSDFKDELIPVHYLEVTPAHILDGCNADSDNIKLEELSDVDPLSVAQEQSGFDSAVEPSCNYKPSELTSLEVIKSQLYCEAKTSQNEDLNNAALYNKGKPANCVIECGKIGDRKYICNVCEKCFTVRRNFVAHLLIHSGAKGHKCEACGKLFTLRSQLVCHSLIHSGESKHKCEDCGKCFTRHGSLLRHSLNKCVDHKYKCENCGICYTRRDHFLRHSLIHSSETK